MSFELYLSNRVRKQKQFADYVPFCSDESLLPDSRITVFEQDRDERLFSERGLAFYDISGHPAACSFMEAGYYGMPWKDGVLLQCGSVRSDDALPNGLAFVHGDYRNIDLIARTDQLGATGMYNLLLSSFQFVAAHVGALLTHTAAVLYNGEAILFCGASGAGKSTQAAAWIKHYDAKPINYDHPCIIWDGNTPIACGTPWGGKEGFCMPVAAPIKAIVFVHQSEESSVYELRKGEAFGRLILINALPFHHPEMDEKLMATVERLVQSVPVYYQECTLTKETQDALHKALYGITK